MGSVTADITRVCLGGVAPCRGSLLAALAAATILLGRNRHYGRIAEKDAIDAVPDVYQARKAQS